jgi:putative ABC transport system substrate-binding protein
MRRRAFITVLGSAAAGPVVARSQRRSVPLVAFLSPRTDETNIGAFQRGLCELGDIEGQNITPETRPADGDNARLPALAWQPASTRYRGTIAGPDGHVGPDLAGDLVRRQAAVIFATGGPPAIRAGMAATKTIPSFLQSVLILCSKAWSLASVGRVASGCLSACLMQAL